MHRLPLLLLVLSLLLPTTAFAQDSDPEETLLHYWSFNDVVVNVDGNIEQPILPYYSRSGNAELQHNFPEDHVSSDDTNTGTTDENAYFDQGQELSLRVRNQDNNGSHIQINFSAEGLESIQLIYATRRTGTGFTTQEVQVRADEGDSFTSVALQDLEGEFDTSFGIVDIDLPELSDSENAQVRIVFDGASAATGATSIDNLTIHGVPMEDVPECGIPDIAETDVDYDARTIMLEVNDPDGIDKVHFTHPDSSSQSALIGLEVMSYPDNTFEAGSGFQFDLKEEETAPAVAEFILQATEMEAETEVGYFITAENTCGNAALVDPPHIFEGGVEGVHLTGNYPNPFAESTTLTYTLPEAGTVRLQVYDMLGRQVATLVDEHLGAGEHHVTWSGKDHSGHPVATGIYLVHFQVNDVTAVRRIARVR